jgi:hypothetical protein
LLRRNNFFCHEGTKYTKFHEEIIFLYSADFAQRRQARQVVSSKIFFAGLAPLRAITHYFDQPLQQIYGVVEEAINASASPGRFSRQNRKARQVVSSKLSLRAWRLCAPITYSFVHLVSLWPIFSQKKTSRPSDSSLSQKFMIESY